MAMQGPHQAAQKSTTMGRVLRAKARSKLASVSSTAYPSNKGKCAFGQRAPSFNRSLGRRTTESQCPQTTSIASLMHVPYLGCATKIVKLPGTMLGRGCGCSGVAGG